MRVARHYRIHRHRGYRTVRQDGSGAGVLTMHIGTQQRAQAEDEALDPGQSGAEQQGEAGLTLDDYARAKVLPVDFLKSLGVSQSSHGRKPAVRIPYYGTAGEEIAVRSRI